MEYKRRSLIQDKETCSCTENSTERPEAVRAGFARIVGLDPSVVLAELERVLSQPSELPSELPFGDGRAAERIVNIVEKELY